MMSTVASTSADSNPGSLSGRVHGGNQPVAFSTVNLYGAGATGYGSAATLYATTTTADNGAGSFGFVKLTPNGTAGSGNNYSCPTSGDPWMYLVATGGNTLNTHDNTVDNTAAVFIAAVGACSTISASTFIDMTEVTTVATLAALQQYFNPVTESIGTTGTYQGNNIGLANAFANVKTLVSLASGGAISSTSLTNSGLGVTVTVTPEAAKINQIANIISSCVNNASSSASNCGTLFLNAVPPSRSVTSQTSGAAFPTATDVAQAAYYMLTNPTDGNPTNLSNLYNLSAAAGAPYQPSLSSVPTDWTIGVSYASTSTCGTNSANFINNPTDIAIDINGYAWIGNVQSNINLTALSPQGAPYSCTAVGAGSTVTSVSIDSNSDVWVAADGSSNVYRVGYSGATGTVLAFPTSGTTAGIASDDIGHIYFSLAGGGSLYEIVNGITDTSAETPTQVSNQLGTSANRIAIDQARAIWTNSGSTYLTRTISTSATSDPNYLNGFTSSSIATVGNTYGIAIDNNNYVYVTDASTDNEMSYLTGSNTGYAANSPWPTANTGGMNTPQAVAVDGAGNAWTINKTNDTTPAGGYGSVSEISNAATALSPTDPNSGGFEKAPSYYTTGRAIAIDQAGDVWAAGAGNTVTEIIGAAVPVEAPFSVAIGQGHLQLKP